MVKKILLAVWVFASFTAFAQQPAEKPEGSDYYLKSLKSSKDSLYQNILGIFEAYLIENPDAYEAMIDRCEVINKAFYDDYEEYNPNYEAFEGCLAELTEKFPDHLEVLLYSAKNTWGEEKLNALNRAIRLWEAEDQEAVTDIGWQLYNQRALHHSYDDAHFMVIRDANFAINLNDTLDLSREMASAHMGMDENDEAIKILLRFKDRPDEGWDLNQKGELFLQLKEPQHALDMFLRAQEDTSFMFYDKSSIAQAFVENGRAEEGRALYRSEASGDYVTLKSKIDLFMFDLEYGEADSLKASYRNMVEGNFWHDPFGKYRLQMFVKAPGLSWSLNDMLRVLVLVALLALCILLPYIWVLPVYSLGVHLKSKGRIYEPSHERWRLKQFCMLSGLILIGQVLTIWVFGYKTWILDYNGEGYQIEGESLSEMADSGIFFFTILLIGTLFFIRRQDYATFWGDKRSKLSLIGIGFGVAFLLRLCLGFITAIRNLLNPPELDLPPDIFNQEIFENVFLSVVETIQAINSEYHPILGFLFVVVLVPFYEEYIFRGVFLSAMQRHIGFFWANVIQASMFALIHDNLELFLFYLAFGMSAGYLRKNSNSLAPGIVMHMVNNLIAFLAILALSAAWS